MSLRGVVETLTDEQRAAEPRSLAVVAYFDGWARKATPLATAHTYPRPLTPAEAESWREGYRDAVAQQAEWERQQHLLHPLCCALCARSAPACPLCGRPS